MICQFCHKNMLGTNCYFTCHNHDNIKISYLTDLKGNITNKYYKYYLEDHHYVIRDDGEHMHFMKYNNYGTGSDYRFQNIMTIESKPLQLNEIYPLINRLLNLKAFL